MKNNGTIFVFCAALFLVACAVNSPVVIPKIQASAQAGELRKESVLVYLDKDFLNEQHESKQLLTVFQYDLGEYFKSAVHDSLKSYFADISQSESKLSADNFDLVIQPQLIQFEAPVPPLVTMSTKTKLTLKYNVIPKAPLQPFELNATGTYELKTKQDELTYNSLEGKDIYHYDVSTGLGLHIPAYSYEAGKDAYMAIVHALDDLNKQLAEALKNIKLNSKA
ncbi:hypothetical protein [Rheinheimera sp. MM224]|uniref:hypothetical protein n=1 Tax=Rheinheimera sp. MM224 TaxID=3019969 RepID=UPI0021F8C1E7|nr:hypothetical protein [Rheinheimera sp. MM224]CAI3791704.1 hypothetical protein JAMGFMIE_00375 [Rheinheimera sp. MM224]